MAAAAQPNHLSPLLFYAWALIVGAVAALGAVVFRCLIAIFHNLLFLGKWSFVYDANIHTPESPWGPFIILVPVLAAAGVVFLVSNFAPEAKGHGVPEVMDAVYYHNGVIRPIVAAVKSVASALSIGSGGSVGREGPIIQIGASFASALGQLLRLPTWQRITLIAAGAGAGIAATFNTPIGGVLFAVEILLHEVSARTLVPVTIATVTASYIARLVFGNHPSFVISPFLEPSFHGGSAFNLMFFVGLGVIAALVSVLYIRSIYAFEDFFEQRVPGGYYLRHMLGMLAVGVIMYVLQITRGHYYVEGVGYATVQDVLSGNLSWFLLALFGLKLLTTSLTLGSGASGGVFSPALFMGATLGGAYGMAVRLAFPELAVQPADFAVAGMAGLVGGSTGAAMAAIVMIFEMTLDYTVIIPITITVALSYGLRTMLQRESIYTLKLVRRGHAIPTALQANFYYLCPVKDLMDSRVATVSGEGTTADLRPAAAGQADAPYLVVVAADQVIGFLIRECLPLESASRPQSLAGLADKRYVVVGENQVLLHVMTRMRCTGASIALVSDRSGSLSASSIRGFITKQQIADAAISGTALFSD